MEDLRTAMVGTKDQTDVESSEDTNLFTRVLAVFYLAVMFGMPLLTPVFLLFSLPADKHTVLNLFIAGFPALAVALWFALSGLKYSIKKRQ